MEQMALLEREHRLIESLAGDLRAICAAPAAPEPPPFLNFRREFSRLLSVHLKREDWVIYPILLASPRPEVRDAARHHARASAALSAAFGAYCRDWTTSSIAADWAGFGKATNIVLDSLEQRIAVEDNELYPLLLPAPQAMRAPAARAGHR